MNFAIDWTTFFGQQWVKDTTSNVIAVAVIVVVALLVRLVLHLIITRVVRGIVSGVKKRQGVSDTRSITTSPLAAARTVQRTRTLGSVLSNVVTAVTAIVALVSIIAVVLPQAAGSFSLITAALGAGLGFGAQGIVKDIFNGLTMVIEDQVGVGDVIDTGFATGVVESVGIRTTQVRDVNGVLWYVHNGDIQRVGNMSQGWARVIIDLAVPYNADVQAVQERMLETAEAMAAEPKWKRVVLERPEIWGIESISAEAIVVRIVMKTRAGTKDDVARELRVRLKATLDAMGVKLPSLNQVVLSGFEEAHSVQGARPPSTAPIVPQKPPRLPRKSRTNPLKPED